MEGQTIAVLDENDSPLFYNIADIAKLTPDGGGDFAAYYYLTDHLGSIRAIIDESGNVVGYTDYYPFGMTIPGRVMTSLSNDFYKYNGKQLDDEYGLNWLDYGWRPLDAEVGRWWSVDPAAEKYPSQSSYVFVANNPLLYIDPEGLEYYVDSLGYVIQDMEVLDEDDPTVYLVVNENTLMNLGAVGGEIYADIIFEKLLEVFTEMAEGMDPITFYNLVKPGGDWDLKNNMNTIFGLSNMNKGTFFTFKP